MALARLLFLVCGATSNHASLHPHCKLAWSLFESGDDDYLFILFWSCKVRATASTAAAHSACAARFASCDSLLCRRAAHAPLLYPCLHAYSPCFCVHALGAQAACDKCHY